MSSFSRRTLLTRAAGTAAAVSLATVVSSERAEAAGRQRIKVGQIGVGHSHAANKMRVFRNSPDFEMVGVVESDAEMRDEAQHSEEYRDLQWMSQAELLNTSGLQAVLVETRVENLLDVAEPCVAAGMHVHLDKPAGESLPQFRRILESADRQGLTVQMGYMFRYNPAVVLLKDLLQKGWLGEVFEIHGVLSKVASESKRKRWARFSGGTMFDLGSHLIDLVVGILGEPGNVTAFTQHAAPIDDGLQDNMLAVLRYRHALASVKASAMEVAGFDRRHFAVCGTEGTLHIQPIDKPAVRLALSEPRGPFIADYQEIDVGPYERYVDDAADFAQIIRGEKQADYTTEHDLIVQETLLKAADMPVS